jgi:alkaline phosphatase
MPHIAVSDTSSASRWVTDSAAGMNTPNVRRDDSHTGEEVLVAAQGTGSERVHGFVANTDLFGIMMRAFEWN